MHLHDCTAMGPAALLSVAYLETSDFPASDTCRRELPNREGALGNTDAPHVEYLSLLSFAYTNLARCLLSPRSLTV